MLMNTLQCILWDRRVPATKNSPTSSVCHCGFPGSSVLKNPPSNARDMRAQPLSQEDPLEKEMAAHSSILAWEIPQTEEPGGLQSMRCQQSKTKLRD